MNSDAYSVYVYHSVNKNDQLIYQFDHFNQFFFQKNTSHSKGFSLLTVFPVSILIFCLYHLNISWYNKGKSFSVSK